MGERIDARTFRKRMTQAERRLRAVLRDGRLLDARFRRQYPVKRFILDFYCPLAKLAIEVDGEIHTHQAEYDEARTAFPESRGIQVMRFRNDEVLSDLPGVLTQIKAACALHLTTLTATPFQWKFAGWSDSTPDD